MRYGLFPACLLAVLVGCAPRTTLLKIQAVRDAGRLEDLYQQFDECYYATTPAGNLDLVMRSRKPSQRDPTQTIAQVVHLHCFWRPRPGVTYAEPSQINGYVAYMIQTGPTAISYEGGMFISFKIDERKKRITGKLESSLLKPLRRRGGALQPFGVSFAKGTFVGIEHRRRVTGILNEMERFLGPRPEYQPPTKPFVR